MNAEKRRCRAKAKAKISRIFRNGGYKRLERLIKNPMITTIEDIRMFGQIDSRLTKRYIQRS